MLTTGHMRPWLLILAAAATVVALSTIGTWKPLERWAYDRSMEVLGASDAAYEGYMAVITIDEASLESVGPWPWPRAILAELLECTAEAGADVIAFDVLLAEPREDDARLESTIEALPCIVLPYHGAGPSTIGPEAPFGQHSVLAHGDVLVDPDGVVRRIPALLWRNTKTPQPSVVVPPLTKGDVSPLAMSIEAVRQFLCTQQSAGVEPLASPVQVQHDNLTIGAADYPLDGHGNILFTFPSTGELTSVWPGTQLYSAIDILDGKIPPGELESKLVFIGTSAVGLPDRHMSSQIHQGPIPGVFFHAATAGALLSGNVMGIMSPVLSGALAAVLVLFQVGFIYYHQEPVRALFLIVVVLIIMAALYIFLIFYHHIWFPLLHLAGTTLVFYVFGLIYQYTEARAARKQLADSMSRYFAPMVLQEILAGEANLVTREVEGTVVFADFSGFTSLAEKLSPLTTVCVLNQHLAGLVEIIFDYGGTLDKFTGDGVMAFFGAPLPEPAHRELAVAAAWDMQEFCEGLPKGKETGFELLNLRLAVGIASGRFVVGNIGAGERFDYTAIGDIVNTAARLEQLAGPGEILLDEHTAEAISGQWVIQDLGMQVLKGKQSPQRLYRLIGRREYNHGLANKPKENNCN